VSDVKDALGVLWMFVPLPLFWALFDQQVKPFTSLLCYVKLNLVLVVFHLVVVA